MMKPPPPIQKASHESFGDQFEDGMDAKPPVNFPPRKRSIPYGKTLQRWMNSALAPFPSFYHVYCGCLYWMPQHVLSCALMKYSLFLMM